ncbi:hypothetical protein EG832_18650, partial [bacterium]|nr:hypothetical protein [bacterium]
ESLDAAEGLAKLRDPRGFDYLQAALKSENRDIREVAQEILAGLEKSDSIR